MATDDDLMRKPLTYVAGAVVGAALGAVAVAIGRIWAQSYYQTFGLATSDLSFNPTEFTFLAREAIATYILAAVVAGLLAQIKAPEKMDAATCTAGGRDWWLRRNVWLWTAFAAAVAHVLFIVLLASRPTWAEFPAIGTLWLIAVGGVTLGGLSGALWVAFDRRTYAHWQPAFALVTVGVVMFLPFVASQWGAMQAEIDADRQRLPQAILTFAGPAPFSIRSSDEASTTDPVNIVLITNDRIAVAHPLGCRRIGVAEGSGAASGDKARCEVVSIPRDSVSVVRYLGRSPRPLNDEIDGALDIALVADMSTEISRSVPVGDAREDHQCERSEDDPPVWGVWFRLVAEQGGRLHFDSAPSALFLVQQVDGELDCQRIFVGSTRRLAPGDELFLLAAGTGRADGARQELHGMFEPLRFLGGDKTVGGGRSLLITVPADSIVSVTVDLDEDDPAIAGLLAQAAPPPPPQPESESESDQTAVVVERQRCDLVRLKRTDAEREIGACFQAAAPGEGAFTFETAEPAAAGLWEVTMPEGVGWNELTVSVVPAPEPPAVANLDSPADPSVADAPVVAEASPGDALVKEARATEDRDSAIALYQQGIELGLSAGLEPVARYEVARLAIDVASDTAATPEDRLRRCSTATANINAVIEGAAAEDLKADARALRADRDDVCDS